MNNLEILSSRDQQETITSLEIARIAGKQHKNMMRDIRNMEPAWVKNTGLNFELSSYRDSTGRALPCYVLTKMESLFVTSKFNDDQRAKLILRWMDLELKEQERKRKAMEQIIEQQQMLSERLEDAEEDADYAREVLQSHGTLTSTQIAKEMGMSARRMHQLLHGMGILFQQSGEWQLYAPYHGLGLVDKETMLPDGQWKCHRRTRWTEQGHRFVIEKMRDCRRRMTPKAVYVQMTFNF